MPRRVPIIPNWRQAWRMATVQLGSAAALFGALPIDQQTAVLAVLGMGRERLPLTRNLRA